MLLGWAAAGLLQRWASLRLDWARLGHVELCCPANNRPPIHLHRTPQDNTNAAIRFVEYATAKDDVWFVTVSQLLDWMKNPGE